MLQEARARYLLDCTRGSDKGNSKQLASSVAVTLLDVYSQLLATPADGRHAEPITASPLPEMILPASFLHPAPRGRPRQSWDATSLLATLSIGSA